MPRLLSLTSLRALGLTSTLDYRDELLGADELKRRLQASKLRAYASSRSQTISAVLLHELRNPMSKLVVP